MRNVAVIESLEARRLLAISFLKDVVGGPASSYPVQFSAAGFRAVFTPLPYGYESALNTDLWQTDGSSAGTSLLMHFAGVDGQQASLNGYNYFFADDGVHGYELWRTDGTTAGTSLFDDIRAGASGSTNYYPSGRGPFGYPESQSNITQIGGRLFFFANDGSGYSLWTSDGTVANTQKVTTTVFSDIDVAPVPIYDLNGVACFEAFSGGVGQLWRSDGTSSGTYPLFTPVTNNSVAPYQSPPVVSNGKLFFTSFASGANRLYETDGTLAVTRAVPGTTTLSNVYGMQDIDGLCYFGATSGSSTSVYKTDGTTTGLVTNVAMPTSGVSSSYGGGDENWIAASGNTLIFTAKSGSNQYLYMLDRTTNAVTYSGVVSLGTYYMFGFDGAAYLDLNGQGIYQYVQSSSTRLKDGTNSPTGGEIQGIVNNVAYMSAYDSVHGAEPWKLTDDIAPFIWNARANLDSPAHSVSFNFDESVATSLSDAKVSVLNLGTNTALPPGSFHIAFDPVTKLATLTFPGLPNQRVGDGQYRVTIDKSVSDLAGNAMAADYTFDFTFRAGDANHDGLVNTSDFTTLAANFNKTGRVFSQGDFNYDGTVNALDFNALAANFGATLPAAQVESIALASKTPSLFSASPVPIPIDRILANEKDLVD